MSTQPEGKPHVTAADRGAPATDRPALMLALATVGFAVTFWAWALLSPLGASLREQLSLTSFQQSLVVAVPVVVGSLGRIPVGDAWSTDLVCRDRGRAVAGSG